MIRLSGIRIIFCTPVYSINYQNHRMLIYYFFYIITIFLEMWSNFCTSVYIDVIHFCILIIYKMYTNSVLIVTVIVKMRDFLSVPWLVEIALHNLHFFVYIYLRTWLPGRTSFDSLPKIYNISHLSYLFKKNKRFTMML